MNWIKLRPGTREGLHTLSDGRSTLLLSQCADPHWCEYRRNTLASAMSTIVGPGHDGITCSSRHLLTRECMDVFRSANRVPGLRTVTNEGAREDLFTMWTFCKSAKDYHHLTGTTVGQRRLEPTSVQSLTHWQVFASCRTHLERYGDEIGQMVLFGPAVDDDGIALETTNVPILGCTFTNSGAITVVGLITARGLPMAVPIIVLADQLSSGMVQITNGTPDTAAGDTPHLHFTAVGSGRIYVRPSETSAPFVTPWQTDTTLHPCFAYLRTSG